MQIQNALVWDGARYVRKDVWIRAGQFAPPPAEGAPLEDSGALTSIDAAGMRMLPGFIDLHCHGIGGHSWESASLLEMDDMAARFARQGTTSVLASPPTAPMESMRRSCRAVGRYIDRNGRCGAEVLGLFPEGPFLSPLFGGAQDRASMRLPSVPSALSMMDDALPHLRMMTLAPELEGAHSVIQWLYEHGAVAAIGHTDATYGQACDALQDGASHFTHLFNAMRGLHHREPGTAGAGLFPPPDCAPRVELIADGVHVHPSILCGLFCQMPERICLITDSILASGLPDGVYRSFQRALIVQDGVARNEAGALAGSTLTQWKAYCNMRAWGVPDERLLPALTSTPAEAARVSLRKGRIAEGYDADFLLVRDEARTEEGGPIPACRLAQVYCTGVPQLSNEEARAV